MKTTPITVVLTLLTSATSTYVYASSNKSSNKPTEIVITAKGQSISSSATRLAIPTHESPRTVETVTKDDLPDANPSRIENHFSYVPGVTAGISQGGLSTSAVIRGFGTTGGQVFVNGYKDNERFYVRDLSTVERVEILKGHSSVLYGSGSPGGTLNYITKHPVSREINTATITLGNRDLKRLSLDKGGLLKDDDSVSYRLVATAQDAEHFYDNASNDRWVIAPSMRWKLSDRDEVRLDLEVAHTNTPFLFGTVYAKGQFLFDKSYIDPRAKSDRDFYNLRSVWNHSFSDKWSLHTSLASYHTKRDDLLIGFFYKTDEETLRGYYRDVQDDYTQYTTRTELRGVNLGRKNNHNIIIGIEKNKDSGAITANRITDFTLDVHNPQFDTDFRQLTGQERKYTIKNAEAGIYAIDKIDLNSAWNLLIGGRYSAYETNFIEDSDNKLRDQHTTSKSVALNYHPSPSLALYGSIAQSFSPNSGQDRNNNFFDPKEAVQYELGVRMSSNDKKHAFHAALYQIDQDNLLTSDPIDRDYKILVGAKRHRGLETAITSQLSSQVNVTANYSYLDARITKNNDGLAGNTALNAPKHSGAVRLSYKPASLPKMTAHVGMVAVGKRQGDSKNTFTVPGYGRIDIGAQYKHHKTTYSLNIANAFDKDYIAASYLEDDLYRGAPRTIWFSASHSF